jgi:riboflavin kinase / FMN adenylyltransferase
MKVYSSPEEFRRKNPSDIETVVTVGNFDGIHQGHRQLIDEVKNHAKAHSRLSVIVTFDPHTRSVISAKNNQPILSTFDEKALLLEHMGIDALVRIHFNSKFRALSAEEFVRRILADKLKAREWILGSSHTFGKNKAGNMNSLQEITGKYDITTFTLNLVSDGKTPISSTKIRELISSGNIEQANRRLGHPYLIAAQRVEGKKIGRKLGYPTLNFEHPCPEKVVPPAGVFAAKIEYKGKEHTGALYFGKCPTFRNRSIHFEFHMLSYEGDLPGHGDTAYLWLHTFIRKDKAFTNQEFLTKQIKKDVDAIHRFFAEEK